LIVGSSSNATSFFFCLSNCSAYDSRRAPSKYPMACSMDAMLLRRPVICRCGQRAMPCRRQIFLSNVTQIPKLLATLASGSSKCGRKASSVMLLDAVMLRRVGPDLDDGVKGGADPTDDVDMGDPGDETGSESLRRLAGDRLELRSWRLCVSGGSETGPGELLGAVASSGSAKASMALEWVSHLLLSA